MGETKKLLSNSTIIFVGAIVGSFFAYLFNMLVGRWLGPAQYGEFSAIFSLLTILSVGGGTILTVVMRYSGELYATKNYQAITKLLKVFSRYVLFFGLLLFFIGLILIKPIANFFSIEHLLPVAIALSSFIFGFLILVNRGVLQGTQRFFALSVTNCLEPFLRLVLGVILIKLGLEVSGAILGAVLATVIAYFVTFVPLLNFLKKENNTESKASFAFDKKEIINYSFPTLIVTLLLAFSLNIDVVLVKHYFAPEEAGMYAAISTIAKIILYATAPVISVMFPMISEKKAKGNKHFGIFLFSLLLTLAGALVILAVYYVAPGKVISILYGNKYTSYFYLLPQVGFFVILYALVNIMANYFLAIKNFFFLPFFAVIILAQITLISLNHSSLEILIKILISTIGLLFAFMISYYLLTKRQQVISYFRGEYEQ